MMLKCAVHSAMAHKIAYLQIIQVQCEHWRWSKKGMEEGSQASRQRCAEEETVAVHLSGVPPSVSRRVFVVAVFGSWKGGDHSRKSN